MSLILIEGGLGVCRFSVDTCRCYWNQGLETSMQLWILEKFEILSGTCSSEGREYCWDWWNMSRQIPWAQMPASMKGLSGLILSYIKAAIFEMFPIGVMFDTPSTFYSHAKSKLPAFAVMEKLFFTGPIRLIGYNTHIRRGCVSVCVCVRGGRSLCRTRVKSRKLPLSISKPESGMLFFCLFYNSKYI